MHELKVNNQTIRVPDPVVPSNLILQRAGYHTFSYDVFEDTGDGSEFEKRAGNELDEVDVSSTDSVVVLNIRRA